MAKLLGALLLLFGAVLISSAVHHSGRATRLAKNGASKARAIPITEAPWVVSVVQTDGELALVGNIVGPNLVLTSTSWIVHIDPRNFVIRAGSDNFSEGGSLHNISKVQVHPSAAFRNYDVGLITVDPPFELDDTRQIITINQDTIVESPASIYSFSETAELIATDAQIYDHDQCNTWFNLLGGIGKGQGCLKNEDLCDDDLGAGVVVDGSLAAMMIDFVICGGLNWPLITTNFSEPLVSMWLNGNIPTVTLN